MLLFERNGLQHGGFDVPGRGVVTRLAWSSCSEVLAAVVSEPSDGGKGEEPMAEA